MQSATEISDGICMPVSNVGGRYKRKINGASETLEKQANGIAFDYRLSPGYYFVLRQHFCICNIMQLHNL